MNINDQRPATVGLSTFAVDTRDRCTQAVVPTYSCEPDGRFYVVEAHGGTEALEIALAARSLGCKTIAEYRARLSARLTAPGDNADALPGEPASSTQDTLSKNRPQVIVVVGASPVASGLRLLAELRSRLAGRNVEVVAMPADASQDRATQQDLSVLELGVVGHRTIVDRRGPTIAVLDEIPRVLASPDRDRPAWVSPYGPSRHRR